MKILITGVGGFVANNIAEWLRCHSEHEVIGIYRSKEPCFGAFHSVCCDLYKQCQAIDNLDFEVVIHFASQLYGDNIKLFLDNTVQASRNLLNISEEKKVKTFIYISSISVCGETKGIIDEKSDRINQNDYEITKWIVERLLEDAKIENKIILRLPRVLGKGIDYTAPWLPKLSYDIMQNQKISYYNPDLKYNALIHTDNLGMFIKNILLMDKKWNGTYVLGSEGEMSIIDIMNFLKYKLSSKSDFVKTEPKEINRCHLVDISKAKEAGFKAETVREVLSKYVADMRAVKGGKH